MKKILILCISILLCAVFLSGCENSCDNGQNIKIINDCVASENQMTIHSNNNDAIKERNFYESEKHLINCSISPDEGYNYKIVCYNCE